MHISHYNGLYANWLTKSHDKPTEISGVKPNDDSCLGLFVKERIRVYITKFDRVKFEHQRWHREEFIWK